MRQAWRAVAIAGGLAVWTATGGGAANAGQPPADTTAGQSPGDVAQVNVPQTPEAHLARAAKYKEKAAAYRREAEDHRKMLADYKAKQMPPGLETKLGQEPPWVKKMRKHCESYITAAENMAVEAEQFAEFHRMRGEEMRGK
jgi:hypothetical protein